MNIINEGKKKQVDNKNKEASILQRLIQIQKLVKSEAAQKELCKINFYNLISFENIR